LSDHPGLEGGNSAAERIAVDALDLEGEGRAAFIDGECGGDGDLARSVRALVEEFTETGDWFRRVAAGSGVLLELPAEIGPPGPPESLATPAAPTPRTPRTPAAPADPTASVPPPP
jgi:hypothetical protein